MEDCAPRQAFVAAQVALVPCSTMQAFIQQQVCHHSRAKIPQEYQPVRFILSKTLIICTRSDHLKVGLCLRIH
jgi:hypothetical protein